MSLPPPASHGIASVTVQRSGTPHPAVTTLAFANASAFTAASCNAKWRIAISGANTKYFNVANMIVGWTIIETYVLVADSGGNLTSDSNTTPLGGTRVANGLPVNTSVVANKTVALVGRQYRGRMLLPASYLDVTNVDANGIISATPLGNITSFLSSMVANLVAASIPPVLLHQTPLGGGSPPSPTSVSGIVPRNRIGTIRHRIRQ